MNGVNHLLTVYMLLVVTYLDKYPVRMGYIPVVHVNLINQWLLYPYHLGVA